jgi:NAD(P)-dependent dehydrogenase (short-subunit alcohol dehydrogenase family)
LTSLDGTIAVVTGASRGVGKGIALGLGEAGATVYVTGSSRARTSAQGSGLVLNVASHGAVTPKSEGTSNVITSWRDRASR